MEQVLTMKQCGHCGKIKPATAEFYHRDNKRPSGYQSWCKECVKAQYRPSSNYNGNGSPSPIIDTDNELIELYLMAYLEGYNKSNNRTYGGRIREAREYAIQVCPQAEPFIKAYGASISAGKRLESREEILGLEIVTGIRKLNLKRTFKKGEPPTVSQPKQSSPAENLSLVKMYCAWVEQNDFVPQDALLAHFTGATRGAFVGSRRKLAEMGYILEQVDWGYKIAKRPAKEKTIDDMSKDEVVALLKKLLT